MDKSAKKYCCSGNTIEILNESVIIKPFNDTDIQHLETDNFCKQCGKRCDFQNYRFAADVFKNIISVNRLPLSDLLHICSKQL